MNLTEQVVANLSKQIELVKELEQSRLFEKAQFVAEKVGRNASRESDNDYWFLMDKTGKVLESGTIDRINRWITWRKLQEGAVYFKQQKC